MILFNITKKVILKILISLECLKVEPNITPPFKISVTLYASKMRKAHQGNLLN